jgi:hypothetical protein
LIWERVQDLGDRPYARYDHCAAFLDPYLLIFPGRNDSEEMANNLSLVNQLCAFDIRANSWAVVNEFGKIPKGRWGASLCVLASTIMYFGGLNCQQFCKSTLITLETNRSKVATLAKQYKEEVK